LQRDPERLKLMQTIILSCVFGAVCTMVLWVVSSAAAKRDMMIRRGGRLLPPEEFEARVQSLRIEAIAL